MLISYPISSNGPASHLELIEKMSANVKRTQKAIKLLSKEAALFEVEKIKQKPTPQPQFLIVKRMADECDAQEFQNTLVRELKIHVPELRALVVFMEDKPTTTSQLLLVCTEDEELLKRIAVALCDVLEIKLGEAGPICKNGRFQAKFTAACNAKTIKKCDQVVGELLQ